MSPGFAAQGFAVGPARRVGFLDGLRGVAALQVVALHYLSAFLPAIALMRPHLVRHEWERLLIHSPLFLAVDGYTAVYVFFLISGAALTYSFQGRPYAVGVGLARRLVRLGIPMAASVLIAGAGFALIPSAHVIAGQLSGSVDWLVVIGPPDVTLRAIIQEILLWGMLAGHAGQMDTVLPKFLAEALALPPTIHSFNGPLWTLHIEFYGSLLVLGLVALRAAIGSRWHAVCCLVLGIVFLAHQFCLFIVGHMLAPALVSPRWQAMLRLPWVMSLGVGAILGAMAVAMYQDWPWLVDSFAWHEKRIPLAGRVDVTHAQSEVVALLLFAGVIMLAPIQALLVNRPLRWLGRISFSLYLTHFTVLFTLASQVFVTVWGSRAASLVATFVGVSVTFLLAWVFDRYVDQPTIALSRRIGQSRSQPGSAEAALVGADKSLRR